MVTKDSDWRLEHCSCRETVMDKRLRYKLLEKYTMQRTRSSSPCLIFWGRHRQLDRADNRHSQLIREISFAGDSMKSIETPSLRMRTSREPIRCCHLGIVDSSDYDFIGVTRAIRFDAPCRLINDCCLLEMPFCVHSSSQDENFIISAITYSASSIRLLSHLGLSAWNGGSSHYCIFGHSTRHWDKRIGRRNDDGSRIESSTCLSVSWSGCSIG